jgi:Icc-related predicted phosphoesterase
VKIVAIADTHRDYNVIIPKGDIFIHAGDIDIVDITTFLLFCEWIKKLSHKYKIVIAGNHDSFAYNNSSLVKNTLAKAKVIYLENSGCEIKDIKFWGSPITPTFMNWYFMANRGPEIERYWKMIPQDTEVLITHGPAHKILDGVLYCYGDHHQGCEELRKYVDQIKPKLHICGHIHGSSGIYQGENTLFVNASVLDEEYKLAYHTKNLIKKKGNWYAETKDI